MMAQTTNRCLTWSEAMGVGLAQDFQNVENLGEPKLPVRHGVNLDLTHRLGTEQAQTWLASEALAT